MVLLRWLLRLCARLFHHPWMYFLLVRSLTIVAFLTPSVLEADNVLPICYREDTAPFSYLDEVGHPIGYTVELCERAAKILNSQTRMVPVTAENRFETLNNGDCDLLCEATTVTLRRREDVDFSFYTFLTGSAFLYPKSLSSNESSDEKIQVGYLRGTTVELAAKAGTIIGGNSAQYVIGDEFEFQSHEDARNALMIGSIHGYLADREILEAMLEEFPSLDQTHRISLRNLTYEPYAIAVRRGDHQTRLDIDTALAKLFTEAGLMRELLGTYIPTRQDDRLLEDLFKIQSIPE